MTNKDIALQGENLAANYLQTKGYKIITRNWRYSRMGEIDIIAQYNNEIIFVEVKARTSKFCGDPAESVTPSKQRQIMKLAEIYISQNDFGDKYSFRFDVISIVMKKQPEILHIESAFTT